MFDCLKFRDKPLWTSFYGNFMTRGTHKLTYVRRENKCKTTLEGYF